jgi:hypothetical protein
MGELTKSQPFRLYNQYLLVPYMLVFSIIIMMEFYPAMSPSFYVGVFIFFHAFITLVFNWNRYNDMRFGTLKRYTVSWSKFYDVFLIAPLFIVFGWKMTKHFRNRFLILLSGLAIAHGISTFLYNGYSLLSRYMPVPNIKIGDMYIFHSSSDKSPIL